LTNHNHLIRHFKIFPNLKNTPGMKTNIFFLSLFLNLIFSNAFSQVMELNRQTKPIVIDGKPDDWSANLRNFDSESKIKYEFKNDDENLYFILKSDEKTLLRQMELAGMSVKFVVKEKPKRIATIVLNKRTMRAFQSQGGRDGMSRRQDSEADRSQLVRKNEFLPKDTAQIKGFKFAKDIVVAGIAPDNKSINFAKGRANGQESIFEMVIPLREFFGDNYQMKDITRIPVQFQLTINAPDENFGGRSFGAEPGGGMGGRRGGGQMDGPEPGRGMGGEGEMGDRSQMRERFAAAMSSMTEKTIKLEFQLSTSDE